MNNHKAEFDFSFSKKEAKPNILFPISIGQKYLQGDKFEAIIAAANEQCGTIRFIPVLQTHAKKMWLNVDDKSAYQKANKDRNLWLARTKEARSRLKVEDKEFKLPLDNYSSIKALENDPRCWEYWLVQSEYEKSFVENRYLTNLNFQNLINNAVLAYYKTILIKNRINLDDLPKGEKEFYIEHAKNAIFDELGIMKKWQTVFAGQYDCMAYPISETNIENDNGSVVKGIGALVVDCFHALFDKGDDIKLPIIDIRVQSLNLKKLNQRIAASFELNSSRIERRNTIPKASKSNMILNFNNNVTGLRRSKSTLHLVSNTTNNCAPIIDNEDTSSQSSSISSTSVSTDNSTTNSPQSSLSSSPESNSEIHSYVSSTLISEVSINSRELSINEIEQKPTLDKSFNNIKHTVAPLDNEKVVAVLPVSVLSINDSKSDHAAMNSTYMTEQDQTVLLYLEEESKLSVKDVVQGIVQKVEQTDDMNIQKISRLAAFTRFLLEPPVEQIQPANITPFGSPGKNNNSDSHTCICENKSNASTAALRVQPSSSARVLKFNY